MSNMTTLSADDGHQFNAYLVEPLETLNAGIVLLPEIFGITQHMRDMADAYSKQGYRAVVPALFDRVEKEASLTYDEFDRGLDLMRKCQESESLADIQAALNAVSVDGKVAVQGYCWGGSLAFLSACELPVSAAVSYYGGQIINQLHRRPQCPVLFHFGREDKSISEENVTDIMATLVNYSNNEGYVYDGADHAFANHDRTSFDASAAELANQRSTDFLAAILA